MPQLFRTPAFWATRAFLRFSLTGAAALVCLQGPAFAAAVPAEAASRTAQVAVSGLNLASSADVAKLDARIRTAARTVCTPADRRDLRAISDRATCQATAIQRAAAKRDLLVASAQAEQLAGRSKQSPATN